VYSNPLQAYDNVEKATTSGRELEASVLSRAARKLRECQQNWDAPDREERLNQALKFNQLVWSIFQGELKKEDNPLDGRLRLDLLRLSAFVDRRLFETMADPAPEKLNIVIDINNNIAAGLRQKDAPAR